MASDATSDARSEGLRVEWLGRVPYLEALEIQEKRQEALRAGAGPETLLLLEHPPVVTLGRGADAGNVLVPERELAEAGITVHRVSRGGDVTYHGPGQLVGYLIVDLCRRGDPDVRQYLRELEAALVEALAALGLPAHVRTGMTGVFAGPGPVRGDGKAGKAGEAPEAGEAADGPPSTPRKIASIGVGLRGWVTWHGFALNVTTDLTAFGAIVPCGLRGVAMTSLAAELGVAAPELGRLELRTREAVAAAVGRRFTVTR